MEGRPWSVEVYSHTKPKIKKSAAIKTKLNVLTWRKALFLSLSLLQTYVLIVR